MTYKTSINIYVYEFNGENFSIDKKLTKENILPFDPMFLMKDTQMDVNFTESENPTSELHEQPFSKEFQISDSNGNVQKGKITITLSYCKKEERSRYGRNAGDTPFGKAYLKRNLLGSSGYDNISIVRAGLYKIPNVKKDKLTIILGTPIVSNLLSCGRRIFPNK